MEITDKVGQAKPEPGNATSFNWWLFTDSVFISANASLVKAFVLFVSLFILKKPLHN